MRVRSVVGMMVLESVNKNSSRQEAVEFSRLLPGPNERTPHGGVVEGVVILDLRRTFLRLDELVGWSPWARTCSASSAPPHPQNKLLVRCSPTAPSCTNQRNIATGKNKLKRVNLSRYNVVTH